MCSGSYVPLATHYVHVTLTLCLPVSEEPQTIFDEPMDSTVTNISAVISWEASGGFVDNYTIIYQLANDDTVFTVTTEDNTTTTIMLTNLTPSSAYLATVVTNNQNGASDPSPVIQFSTQCEFIVGKS